MCQAASSTPKWRQDFPIEWEGDHYVTRREMVKFHDARLVAAGRGELGHRDRRQVPASRLAWRSATSAAASALEQTGSMLFRYPTDQDPCIAVRTPEGKLVAYSQVCTHLSCAVVYDKAENALFCPCHHGCSTSSREPDRRTADAAAAAGQDRAAWRPALRH